MVREQDGEQMVIRTTTEECFVILYNGLTLELWYAEDGPTRGCWLLGESFMSEVVAAQA